MKKRGINNSKVETVSLWNGYIKLTDFDGLKKGSLLSVRMLNNKEILILDKNRNHLWSPPEELSQVIASFLNNNIFIGASVVSPPSKKNNKIKINFFVLANKSFK